HEASKPAAQAAHDHLGVDDVAAFEAALVFAPFEEELAQGGVGAAFCLQLFGCWVFAAGDGASLAAGGLAGVGEPDWGPGADTDHAAGVAASSTGLPVLIPEGLRAAVEDADAEASDRGIPEDILLLLRPEPGFVDHRFSELCSLGHFTPLRPQTIRQHIDSTDRDPASVARHGAIWRDYTDK